MKQTLEEILQGKNVRIPMYDFRSHSRCVHAVKVGGKEGGRREGGRERRVRCPHTCQKEGREAVGEGGVDDRPVRRKKLYTWFVAL